VALGGNGQSVVFTCAHYRSGIRSEVDQVAPPFRQMLYVVVSSVLIAKLARRRDLLAPSFWHRKISGRAVEYITPAPRLLVDSDPDTQGIARIAAGQATAFDNLLVTTFLTTLVSTARIAA
jgi:hypothetical protein